MDIAQNTPFNPITTTSGTFTWAGGEGTHILVINESYQNLFIKFSGGQISYVPANDRRLYYLIGEMAQVQNQVEWVVQSSLKTINTINQVVVEVYAPGEEMPESYPAPVLRQTNVQGNITATSILIENPTPIEIIKAIDTTTGNSYVDWIGNTLNLGGEVVNSLDGVLAVWPGDGTLAKTTIFSGSMLLANIKTQDITPLTIFDPNTNRNYLVLRTTAELDIGDIGTGGQPGSLVIFGNPNGATTIDVNGNFIQNTGSRIVAQLIDATTIPSGSADLGFHVAASNSIVSTVNNINKFSVSSSGPNLLSGTMSFLSGSVSRLSIFGPYTSATVNTRFAHNLGAVPDLVIVQPNGGLTTSRTTNVNFANFDATTFEATSNIAGFTFWGMALAK